MTEVVATADGYEVVARFYAPRGELVGAIIVLPAMGVLQDYYAPFATWAARQGFLTATFDYRGTGASRSRNLRGFKADLYDWARFDCGAVVDELCRRARGAPAYCIAHSLGAQILAFIPGADRISKVVTIAAGNGYWGALPHSSKWRAWWLFRVVAPLSVRLFGYFPGKKLGMVGDLPKGVMNQWRRWCLHPEYACAEGETARAAFAALRIPIVSICFTDDEMSSAETIESLHGFYVNAPCKMKRLAPQDVGLRRIGHFGFFRPGHEEPLWRTHLLTELKVF